MKTFKFTKSDKKIIVAVDGKVSEHSSLTRAIRWKILPELFKWLGDERDFTITVEKGDKDEPT